MVLVLLGNETEAIRLIELGMDASTPDQYQRYPMHFAAESGKQNYYLTINLVVKKRQMYEYVKFMRKINVTNLTRSYI